MSVTTIFETVRHELAVLIFALIIPVYAFNLAYPEGPREMINGIVIPLYKMKIHNRQTITLANQFTPFDPAYIDAIVAIEQAPAGTEIDLVIKDNFGGMVMVLNMLEKAIKDSKAFITITLDDFGWSCGSDILLMGNILIMPTDTLTGFHTGSMNGETMLPSWATTGTPDQQAAWKEVVRLTKPYLKWFTPEEYKVWLTGAPVFLSGREICEDENRGVDILYHVNGACIIRGNKK
jgi:hypothetical protein